MTHGILTKCCNKVAECETPCEDYENTAVTTPNVAGLSQESPLYNISSEARGALWQVMYKSSASKASMSITGSGPNPERRTWQGQSRHTP